MWWDPASESEVEVSNWLRYAGRTFASDPEKFLVFGVGSFITPQGLRPLVLLNQFLVPELSTVPTFLPYEFVPQRILQQLAKWELPRSTVFLAVTSPEQLSASPPIGVTQGSVLRCQATGKQGTVGPSVEGLNTDGSRFKGVLTAGHVTPKGLGSVMELVQQQWLGAPSYPTIGSVMVYEDPALKSGPGYDVSVIKLNSNAFLNGFTVAGVASLQGPLTAPVLCTMYGGVSGTATYTSIVGALLSYGTGPVFSNSWLFVPASVAQLGDSGSAIRLSSTSQAVGLLVGGSRGINSSQFLCWYAQDLSSIQKDVLTPKNITLL